MILHNFCIKERDDEQINENNLFDFQLNTSDDTIDAPTNVAKAFRDHLCTQVNQFERNE